MTSEAARALAWLRARDPNLAASRRAARAAIVMPGMFALADKVIGNPAVATFAAFGSFAMLLLVDYGGPMRDRLFAQAALIVSGAVLVCAGTAVSRSTWLAVVAMAVVGAGVIFAGVVSSVLASSTTALLIAFILPVTLPGPLSSIPDRLAGWGLASAASFLAVAVLWPAPTRDPLRAAAASACRALAARLQAEVSFLLDEGTAEAERDEAIASSKAAVQALDRLFYATPFRPTGLTTSARAVVRLVDELGWLNDVLAQTPARINPDLHRAPCAVKATAAAVLERSAELLETSRGDPEPLRAELVRLRTCLAGLEANAMLEVPATSSSDGQQVSEIVSALDPSFRAQELTFAVSQIAANIELAAMAERRSWFDRLLGRQPAGLSNTLVAIQERAGGHFDRNSVWLRNSIRGGAGLALAVGVASETGVQHSFWVVLGTLSVLRSNALSTGQSVLSALRGTVAGFAIGAALIWVIGANTTLLWALLPPAILIAGFAPAAISFAAGQAAFTIVLVILFNILQPIGWRVGLVRVEDAAIGCAVSLVVGLLLWPRGAASALGRALAEAYLDSARYLTAAVEFGLGRCDRGVPVHPAPDPDLIRAAAAARRLDDAFRTYLSERGAKPVPLAEVTSLVTGVAGVRLAADAVVDLWRRDDGTSAADRAAAARELRALGDRVTGWYGDFAGQLTHGGTLPDPLADGDITDGPLVEAVRRDLGGDATGVAVRVIWTADHIAAARRLQSTLLGPARGLGSQMRHPLGFGSS
ncbi:MAG TPA: FUSC family protein [Gaiellaceae bacterium]|nr:FUSC family protein [Gaiellaceae bacterium]